VGNPAKLKFHFTVRKRTSSSKSGLFSLWLEAIDRCPSSIVAMSHTHSFLKKLGNSTA